MKKEKLYDVLLNLGLNLYQAKSYIALLALGSGNGYAIARTAHIPTAKVYEALSGLVSKGFAVSDNLKPPQFIPVSPDKILSSLKKNISEMVDEAIPLLEDISRTPSSLDIQSCNDIRSVTERISKVIQSAKEKLLITAWPDELAIFNDELKKALRRKVKVFILAIGEFKIDKAEIYIHRRSDLVKSYLDSRWFLTVSETEGCASFFSEDGKHANGVWTSDKGLTRVFADHILHDISLNLVLKRLGAETSAEIEDELFRLREKLFHSDLKIPRKK